MKTIKIFSILCLFDSILFFGLLLVTKQHYWLFLITIGSILFILFCMFIGYKPLNKTKI